MWIRSAVLIVSVYLSYTIVLAAGGRMQRRPQHMAARAGSYSCGTPDSRAGSHVEQAIAEEITRLTTASKLFSLKAVAAGSDVNAEPGSGPRAVGIKSTVQVRWHCIQVDDTYEGGHLDHSRIQTQIDVLNQVYSANSMPFRFELTSIDYTTNSFWFQNYGPESPGDVAMRKALRVGGIADLNVDSVGSILSLQGEAFFGLSTFPWDLRTNSSDPSLFKDGIVLDYTVLPGGRPDLNKGWVLVHEVFHFFGGYHLWSGGCDTTTGGDEVSDTNPQAEANHGYPMGRHSCSTQYTDMVWNFMDYTDQSCGDKSFTPGQVARATAFAKLYRGIGSSMTTLDVSRRRKSGRQKGL